MNLNNILFVFSVLAILPGFLIIGVYGEIPGSEESNQSVNNATNLTQTPETINLNQTSNSSSSDVGSDSFEIPEIYTGVEHPNEDSQVNSSTPGGDPLIPKYAQGGVNIDIMGHIMEARDSDPNVSAEISFHDHTGANGYISTIIKDFRYMSGVDTSSV